MATIAENIQTLRSIKSDIKNAIIQKGGSVTDAFGTYAQAITNLPSGGGNEDLIGMIEDDITTLNIPEGTTNICKYAFYYRESLTDIAIPNTVTRIGYSAFEYCRAIKSVNIPNGVTGIENYTFRNCSSLKEVTIPNTITYISKEAFYACSSLKEVTIPNSVTLIERDAFCACTSLTAITVLAATPPTLGFSVFISTNDCPIYVPAESVDAYKTATDWSEYASRIQAIGTVTEGDPSGGPIIN